MVRFIKKLGGFHTSETVRKLVLPSGLTVVAEEVPHVPTLSLGIWILNGSRDEPRELSGICHFLEHMVFKGSRKRSAIQIAQKTEAIGGQIDAFTTREQTCYYARVFEEHLETAMEILGDLLCDPMFGREEIDRERGVVIEEIESYENNPEEQAHDLISAEVWPDHPLGMPILGTRETLKSFGTRVCRAFHRERYVTQNVVVTASGRFDFQKLVDLSAKYLRFPLGCAKNGEVPLTRFRSRALMFEREVTQASLCLASRGPSTYHNDRHALNILNMILGAGVSSRLFQRIREDEGLAYTVYSFFDVMRDTGTFGIYLGVAPENAMKSLDLACREIRKLKSRGIRKWEMESAKAQLLMSHFLSYESTYERMNRIATNEIYYGRQASLESAVDRVHAITADDVLEVMDRYLQPGRFSAITLGPPGTKHPRQGDWDF